MPQQRWNHSYHLLVQPSKQKQARRGSRFFMFSFVTKIYPIFGSLVHTTPWSIRARGLGHPGRSIGSMWGRLESLPSCLVAFQGFHEELFVFSTTFHSCIHISFFLFNLFSYINSFQNDGTVVYYKYSCNEICKTDFFIYLQKGVYTGTVVKECLGVGCGKHENYLHVQLFINNI